MTPRLLALLCAAAGAARASAQSTLFSDGFETDTSADWIVLEGSANDTPDFSVEFSFDYSRQTYTINGETQTIPLAPNSAEGAARGLKLTVNNRDDVPAASGLSLFPQGQTFSGDHALRCDVWINYNGAAWGGSGSTEFATFGLNHSGALPVWDDASVPDSDGVWHAVTGEGGAARDYRAYDGIVFDRPLELIGLDGGFFDRDGDGLYEAEVNSTQTELFPLRIVFPADRFETPGAPGKRWVEVELGQRGDLIVWKMDGYLIAERPNLSGFQSGNVMIGMMDVFSSIANPREDNFVIFDNVRVVDLTAEPELPVVEMRAGAGAGEPDTRGHFVLSRRGGDLSQPLEVRLRAGGTATAGQDYEALPAAVTIPAGETEIELPVTPIDDFEGEPDETVTLILAGSSAYELREVLSASVVIFDDGDTTTVQVAAVDPYAYERIAEDNVAFEIFRLGDLEADLEIGFTLSGTALAGLDYASDANSALIPAGETRTLVALAPFDDSEVEGAETIRLALAEGSGYRLGPTAEAEATLMDDDQPAAPILFRANLDEDTSADWDVRFSAANGIEDYTALFGHDYSFLGVPPAPHSGDFLGLLLDVNKTDSTEDGQASVNLYPKGQTFGGNYAVRFDMYLSYGSDNGGTTEHAIFGINHSGGYANRHDTPGSDGVWFAVETDGSASGGRSYVSYLGGPTGQERPAFVATGAADFAPFFTQPPYLAAGAPSGQWVDVEIEQLYGKVTLRINGVDIASRMDLGGYLSGNLMLGLMDTYSSIGSIDNFVIYDSLRVVRLEGAPESPRIAKIAIVDGELRIDFASSTGVPTDFALEQAATVRGPYAPAEAVVREAGAGQFTATLPIPPGPRAFFRVRR